MTDPQPTGEDVAAGAMRLIREVDHDPWGRVSPSVYETARVLSLAPWLPDQDRPLRWVLQQQHADGSWGAGPARHRLLPTLSAVEAMLATLRRRTTPAGWHPRMAAAAAAGLVALAELPQTGPWPDTAAIEILVPALTGQIEQHLNRPEIGELSELSRWAGQRVPIPRGFHRRFPQQIAQRCRQAGGVPGKLHHTFEGVWHLLPAGLAPEPGGLLGSSPAATAAQGAHSTGAQYAATAELAAVARRYGGLFPEAAPITVFERLWVAAALASAGLAHTGQPTLAKWARTLYDPAGVRGAPGLPPDADDTAMVVLVSALAGEPRDPAVLDVFSAGCHFDCYVGEDTGSITANAHALQALRAYVSCEPTTHGVQWPRMGRVRDWLLAHQDPAGWWTDKWHASPYYATERCVTAFGRDRHPHVAAAVHAAADWVLATQHDDGSWGIWGGTAEETAYAVKVLLAGTEASRRQPDVERALERAEPILEAGTKSPHDHPALWHDKTLYAPHSMVHAEVLAARARLHTTHRRARRNAIGSAREVPTR